jgi:hypothetical protein
LASFLFLWNYLRLYLALILQLALQASTGERPQATKVEN